MTRDEWAYQDVSDECIWDNDLGKVHRGTHWREGVEMEYQSSREVIIIRRLNGGHANCHNTTQLPLSSPIA